MSEEILRALMQLFAIITKQDGGVTQKERSYVEDFLKQLVDLASVLEYLILYDEFSSFSGRLKNKEFYLDTSIIFRLLGTSGDEQKIAFVEFIHLLKHENVKLYIFHHTLH